MLWTAVIASTAARPIPNTVHILASGSIMQQALLAKDALENLGIGVCLWSITSFVELQRNAIECQQYNREHPKSPEKTANLQKMFADQSGVFIAVTDYMTALPSALRRMPPGLRCLAQMAMDCRNRVRDYANILRLMPSP